MGLRDFSAVKHAIDTKDARPVKQRPRRTPLAFEGEEKKTFVWGYYFYECVSLIVDMANEYYQFKMEDRDKTVFVTKYGQFVFNLMPFGLSNAPETFCRALGLL